MRKVLWTVLVAGGLFTALPSSAETVNAVNVNCRANASTSAPVVATVSRGEPLSVIDTQGTWSQVSLGSGTACWIATRFIRNHLEASDGITPYTSSRQIPYSARSTASRSSSSSSARRSIAPSSRSRPRESSGTCPCSGSNVCIGPRGGRYCITNVGNKRYGV